MSISVLCTPMRVKGLVWIVSNIFQSECPLWEVYSCGLFDGYKWQAFVGSYHVSILELLTLV